MFLSSFQDPRGSSVTSLRDNSADVSYSEFEEYYEGLSVCIHDDEAFTNILKNAWSIW